MVLQVSAPDIWWQQATAAWITVRYVTNTTAARDGAYFITAKLFVLCKWPRILFGHTSALGPWWCNQPQQQHRIAKRLLHMSGCNSSAQLKVSLEIILFIYHICVALIYWSALKGT